MEEEWEEAGELDGGGGGGGGGGGSGLREEEPDRGAGGFTMGGIWTIMPPLFPAAAAAIVEAAMVEAALWLRVSWLVDLEVKHNSGRPGEDAVHGY